MAQYVYQNFSNGWVVQVLQPDELLCESWLLLPAENLWSAGVRGTLYILALLYLFVGVAIGSDIFMSSIEKITSKKRTVTKFDEETQETVTREVFVWNETVANLSLMAMGSSAPEILLAIVETLQNLESGGKSGLGTFTIIGSAAFNLLIITAICIVSVPSPQVKSIQEFGVFIMTSIWSIFAYAWILIVLVAVSPNIVEPWEAWVTFAFFPIMLIMAYCQDKGWWCKKNKTGVVDEASHANIRVLNTGSVHGFARELGALEKERKGSQLSLRSLTDVKDGESISHLGSKGNLVKGLNEEKASKNHARASRSNNSARFRFRHAAVRSLLGGRKHLKVDPPLMTKQTMADVVEDMRTNHVGRDGRGPAVPTDEELLGKFTFASTSYSVLESSGILEVDILFHRILPSKATHLKMANGTAGGDKENETSLNDPPIDASKFQHKEVVSVEFETLEGSAKVDKDFKYSTGKLVFSETEYRKSITIPIINDLQFTADVDFYIVLKNPSGTADLSNPQVTRVMIIDDDEPGEFQFEEPQLYADYEAGTITANVIREKGCDGVVNIEYSTINGTAKGGDELGDGVDYVYSEDTIEFKHGETTKPIVIDINKKSKANKNFIITLRNPSIGAIIGDHSATVCNLTDDDIDGRLADIMPNEVEEEETWGEQFRNAVTVQPDDDDDGNEIPLKWHDYTLHFITFFWKVFLAFIPPRRYLGAWPTFICAILVVGGMTAMIEQLGTLLGCVISLRASVAGITIVALGTSLPDTFASRTAALHDEGADAAIGNVTGSNSVNVFMGLGIPWIIQTVYGLIWSRQVYVNTDDLISSVVVFCIVGTICIIMLIVRRFAVGGELGGKNKVVQWSCSIFLISLWVLYVLLTSIKAYSPAALPW